MKLYDSIEECRNILPGTKTWEVINDFLQSAESLQMKHGQKKELMFGVFVVCIDIDNPVSNSNLLEAHQKNFDLHHTISGRDFIAYEPTINCSNIKEAYQENDDFILFNKEPGNFITIESGQFCLIGPDMAHMALYQLTDHVRKYVFKIPVIKL